MIEISDILEVKEHIAGLKAAVFDLDDTLYGEKDYIKSGFRAVADMFPDIAGAEEKLWREYEAGRQAIDRFLYEEALYSAGLKQECLKKYRFHKPSIRLYPGVIDMLEGLKGAGIKTGIITDGRPEGQRAKLAALKLENLVDEIIITDELGGIEYRKPNSASYKRMSERLEVKFNQMCYVGDNVRKDFKAPEALGMRCIWYNNSDGIYV